MHRVPSLQWKTWVRLAFVEAGSDWRSLNKLAVQDGFLRDYLIVPADHHELLPPTLRYGVSFVLLRRSHGFPWSYPAPHLRQVLPGPLRGAKAGLTGQSLFQPTQQHQCRILVSATGNATMRTLMLPV